MNTEKIVTVASDPEFYARVCFVALKVAHNVIMEKETQENHAERVAYANRVFRGEDNAILLATHVCASSPKIQEVLSADQNVPDSEIEFALSQIWDARANAFAPVPAPAPASIE